MTNLRICICLILLLFFTSFNSLGQSTNPVFNLSEDIRGGRYDRIQGNPYFYEDWQKGSIVASNGQVYDNIELNFNGFSKELDIYGEDKVRQLIPGAYLKVMVPQESYADIYMRGIHPKFGLDLVCVIYDGQAIKVVRTFQVRKEESHTTTSTSQKFLPTTDHFIIVKGQLENLPIRKKKVIKVLGHEKELEKYLADNNNAVKTEQELIQLLIYYENEILK